MHFVLSMLLMLCMLRVSSVVRSSVLGMLSVLLSRMMLALCSVGIGRMVMRTRSLFLQLQQYLEETDDDENRADKDEEGKLVHVDERRHKHHARAYDEKDSARYALVAHEVSTRNIMPLAASTVRPSRIEKMPLIHSL
jgi:hypothetical protein